MIEDKTTGKIRVTRRFRERHGAKYARHGYDLRKPFDNRRALMAAMVDVASTPEEAETLARYLGILD